MDDLIAKAIDKAAKGGATFSEVRVFGFKYENISTRDGQIETCGQYNDKGYGVRVIKDKAWGFASTAVIDESTVDEITKAAIKEAEATSRVQKKPIELTEEPIIKDKYKTPYTKNPFDIPLEEKIEILKKSDQIIMEQGDIIKSRSNSMNFYKIYLDYGNSEGTRITQEELFTGATVSAIAIAEDNQSRNEGLYEM
ncbi:MAG: DNA gyrase modulator, partial [Candidatus Heimdallarchaeota archaeon]